jgi:hypothetical protein
MAYFCCKLVFAIYIYIYIAEILLTWYESESTSCLKAASHVRWWSFPLIVTWQVSLVEHELLTLPEHLSSYPALNRVHVTQSLVVCVVFCRSLFVRLSVFFWRLCCLFFDLQLLITPLVSSNLSHRVNNSKYLLNISISLFLLKKSLLDLHSSQHFLILQCSKTCP